MTDQGEIGIGPIQPGSVFFFLGFQRLECLSYKYLFKGNNSERGMHTVIIFCRGNIIVRTTSRHQKEHK